MPLEAGEVVTVTPSASAAHTLIPPDRFPVGVKRGREAFVDLLPERPPVWPVRHRDDHVNTEQRGIDAEQAGDPFSNFHPVRALAFDRHVWLTFGQSLPLAFERFPLLLSPTSRNGSTDCVVMMLDSAE
jgi:hypothetical protein